MDREGRPKDERQFITSEEDRINCPFYFKIGACRNGDRCNRAHNKPERSNTLLLPHLYPNLPESMAIANDEDWDDEMYARAQEHVEAFFEEVYLELASYGEIEDLVVLDNVSDHMVGNVYVKFYKEEDGCKAHNGLVNRFYGGRLIQCEFTPVSDFREARCRAFHETRCARGGLCNFMHIKHIPKAMKRRVVREMYEEHPEWHGKPEDEESRKKRKRDDARGKRMPSEERKAMIAQWNAELKSVTPALPAPAPAPQVAPPNLVIPVQAIVPPAAPATIPNMVPPASAS